MLEQHLITVIIPVYKVEEYLEKCVQAVCRQTYKNLEILLVDDGSPDRCPEMCDAFALQDDRIRVIHKKNGGLSSARNAALDVARGEYIAFVDSDDTVEADMIESLYRGIQKYNCEIAICNHYVEENERLVMEIPPLDEEKVYTAEQALKLLLGDIYIRNYAWDKLYAGKLFRGIRYPEGRNYEDIATTYLLFDRAEKICQVLEYGYYYEKRDSSISANLTKEKWFHNTGNIVKGMEERYLYFQKMGRRELADRSMVDLEKYMVTFLNLSFILHDKRERKYYRSFLKEHLEEIRQNPQIPEKEKKIAKIYTMKTPVAAAYAEASYLRRENRLFQKMFQAMQRIKQRMRAEQVKFDFSCMQGKQRRIFMFELPCFDNLGDHAIAYAEWKFLQQIEKDYPEIQLIRIEGWDTPAAVRQLKREITPQDMIFCQGGGNLGNLYAFGEAFRRTIFRAFPDQFLLVFPQTMYFTPDDAGRKELKKSRKIYNRCRNLTLLARDERSYSLMKDTFTCNLLPAKDIVTMLDETEYAAGRREGSILCLRSDKEAALTAEQKRTLKEMCVRNTGNVLITDTVTLTGISGQDREQVLRKKWETFGKRRIVVTDRLHGMIFSLITATPCVVLGNNHFKVRETYRTLSACSYLRYVETVEEVQGAMKELLADGQIFEKPSFSQDFNRLYRYIEDRMKE